MAGSFTYQSSYDPRGDSPGPNKTAFVWGAALDAGYQWQFESGIVLGLGGGLLYQRVAKMDPICWTDVEPLVEMLTRTGFYPRVLFSLGYSL